MFVNGWIFMIQEAQDENEEWKPIEYHDYECHQDNHPDLLILQVVITHESSHSKE